MNNDGLITIPAGTLHHKPTSDGPVQLIEMHSFAIGIHLVTVGAYGDFIDQDGYDDPSWWSGDGWRWRCDEDVDAPRFWDEGEEWTEYLRPDHPVIGVSGYEAEAYASFRAMRLPTEREWERACRGNDDRAYPWGDEWDDRACGHRGHGTRRTKPVGSFPKCVSPFGIYDLVGNVWQWTSDTRGTSWVVCGGAWNNLPRSIGSAGRNGYKPASRFSNLGLRLAADI